MNIKNIPEYERPREKLKTIGKENISTGELLSIIIKSGTNNKNVKDISLELLNTYSIEELKDLNIEDLIKFDGIGEVKAIEIIASIELGKRIYLHTPKVLSKLTSPKEIYIETKYLFYNKKQEYFYALYFNTKQELIKTKLLFIGTINQSTIHPREIFKEAYKVSAYSIVIMHNHPTGDVIPSQADNYITKSIVNIGKIQGIPVLDHIIVSDNNYFSYYDNGKL